MNNCRTAVLLTPVLAAGMAGTAFAAMDAATIAAGLASHDRALHIQDGWMRDPYIVLAPDGYYYLTGTTPNPGDPRETAHPYNTGLGEQSIVGYQVQLWRSQDLISWESLGTPFSLLDGYWAQQDPQAFAGTDRSSWHLWAPEVHFLNGRWHIVHTTPAPVKRGSNLAVTPGDALAGPYAFPLGDLAAGRHDPSLFQDDDGTAWSTDRMRKGTYNLYYCTADRITGPYGPRRFAGRFLGHGTPFQDKQGRWWCTAFFNANVPPISREDARKPSVADTAHTINPQGVTIVPLDVRVLDNGEIHIRANDPAYAMPGPEEAQDFPPMQDVPRPNISDLHRSFPEGEGVLVPAGPLTPSRPIRVRNRTRVRPYP